MENRAQLLILQDPAEEHQAKGTAHLLAQCLVHVELRIGERFEPPALLDGHVLLYPETPSDAALAIPAPFLPTAAPLASPTVVVLDGTWRRSRRLLYLNPWLQSLPRLALTAPAPSRYVIRRARGEIQRSTLEACAMALAQLDGDDMRYAPLWEAMDDFIALQRRLAGNRPTAAGASPR